MLRPLMISFCFGALAVWITACGESSSTDRVALARVDGVEITAEEFVPRLKQWLFKSGVKDNARVRSDLLRQMINEQLLADYAVESGLDQEERCRAMLAYAEQKEVLRAWKKHEIDEKIAISESELREEFFRFSQSVRARHLFAKTKPESEKLYQRLQHGEPFEKLAAEVFSDRRLAASGGDLGYFRVKDMDPAFETVAFALPVGDVSGPVQTADGYSIISVTDRVTRPIITETEYQNSRKHVDRHLRWKKREFAKRDLTARALEDAGLVFENDGLDALLEILGIAGSESSDSMYAYTGQENFARFLDVPVCRFAAGTWTVEEILLRRLSQVKNKHIAMVSDRFSLKLLLQGLVGRELHFRSALQKGYDRDPEVRKQIHKARQMTRAEYTLQKVADTLSVTDSSVREVYTRRNGEYIHPEQVSVQMIWHTDLAVIEQARARADAGADFTQLVMECSADPGKTNHQGIVALSPQGAYGNAADRIFALSTGQIAGPFEDGGRFYLVKLLDRTAQRDMTFEEAKREIEQQLLLEKKVSAQLKFANGLKKNKDVFFDFEAVRWLAVDL